MVPKVWSAVLLVLMVGVPAAALEPGPSAVVPAQDPLASPRAALDWGAAFSGPEDALRLEAAAAMLDLPPASRQDLMQTLRTLVAQGAADEADSAAATRAVATVQAWDDATRRFAEAPEPGPAIELLRGQPMAPQDDALWRRVTDTTSAARALADAAAHGDRDAAWGALLDALAQSADPAPALAASARLAHLEAALMGASQDAGASVPLLLSLQTPAASRAAALPPLPADALGAVLALYEAYGLAPSDPQRRALEVLRTLDGDTARVVVLVAHAHLVQKAWTEEAAGHTPPEVDLMLAARLYVARALTEAAALDPGCVPGATDNTSAIFSFDLSCTDTRYDEDARVVLDLGGNDRYHNNAGGTGIGSSEGDGTAAALLFDARGDDRYDTTTEAGYGVVGGAVAGSAFLFDAAGADRYEARGHVDPIEAAMLGGARSGQGPLDGEVCHGDEQCFYPGWPAVAALVDAGGDDEYRADAAGDIAAAGGAAGWHQSTVGALLDLGGADDYNVTLRMWGIPVVWEQRGHVAAYGGAVGPGAFDPTFQQPENTRRASGLFADLGAEADDYVIDADGEVASHGSGRDAATGIFLDAGGADRYQAQAYGFLVAFGAAAGAEAIGSLLDLGTASDLYEARATGCDQGVVAATAAGAWYGGSALLLDAGGDDRYDTDVVLGPGCTQFARGAAHGAASLPGLGIALATFYERLAPPAPAPEYLPFIDAGGVGILIDAGGHDAYEARFEAPLNQVDAAANGAGAQGTGILLDLGLGHEQYALVARSGVHPGGGPAETFAAANGAGFVGVGVLADGGGDDAYVATFVDGAPLNATRQVPQSTGSAHGGVLRKGLGMLADAGGHDRYTTLVGGGAMAGAATGAFRLDDPFLETTDPVDLGLGVLVDDGGDDEYVSRFAYGAAGGAAQAGTGVLVDAHGDDLYRSEGSVLAAVHGAAGYQGVGLLVDGAGADRYEARSHAFGALNGATFGYGLMSGLIVDAAAMLVDGGGDDVYVAEIDPSDPAGVAQGYVAGAMNGAGITGSAVLVDVGGDDVYQARATGVLAAHAGAIFGTAVLADLAGHDHYNASLDVPGGSYGAMTGGALLGLAALLDATGDDTYRSVLAPLGDSDVGLAFGGASGGALVGLGALVDGAGTNHFEAVMGQGRQGLGGTLGAGGGFLPDNLPAEVSAVIEQLPFEVPNGVGLLVGGTGDDTYIGRGTTQGAAEAYGIGILLDPAGDDRYVAGPDALAQGAAEHGGTGLIADLSGGAAFHLLGESFGQGFAEQGVGILVQLDVDAAADLVVDAQATFASSIGAGVAVRVALGFGDVDLPDMSCSASSHEMLRIGDPAAGSAFYLCSPDRAGGVYVVDPRTGGDMADIPKPPAPCMPGIGCLPYTLLDDLYPGGAADDWLQRDHMTPTASGGFRLSFSRAVPTDPGTLLGQYQVNMVDDWCDYSCAAMEEIDLGTI